MMNHDERREMRKRAASRVKRARAYLLLTFDGEGEPVYSFDIKLCMNPSDARHILMQAVAAFVEKQSAVLRAMAEKRMGEVEQSVKAEEAKEKRSEELNKVA